MKIIENRIVYEIKSCFLCNGSGKVAETAECKNTGKIMRGKTCEHCGTKNKYHHYINTGKNIDCHHCNGTGQVMENAFDTINAGVAKYIANNAEYVLLKDEKIKQKSESLDGEGGFILAMYSSKQTFGCTDYIDHSRDSIEVLKEMIEKSISRPHQTIHYLNKDGSIKTKVLVLGYNGGYSGYFV